MAYNPSMKKLEEVKSLRAERNSLSHEDERRRGITHQIEALLKDLNHEIKDISEGRPWAGLDDAIKVPSLSLHNFALKVTSVQVDHLQDEMNDLRKQVQDDDGRQLGSIAFAFEEKALRATKGKYEESFMSDGRTVLERRFEQLNRDYDMNNMTETERTNYEAFLRRVAPEWSGSFGSLSDRINRSIDEYTGGRRKKVLPPIDPSHFDKLKQTVDDDLIFEYMLRLVQPS